jgi:ABC-type transport system involved in multi-copper enzyme maturation permease subunit
MFINLISIERIRLSRRPILWLSLLICTLYIGLSIGNFYASNPAEFASGRLQIPGMAFDFANALDQLFIAVPFLIILTGLLVGGDYSQRTNQHWLTRVPRHTSLLAKFAVLAGVAVTVQVLALLAGGGVGLYYKSFVYQTPNLMNVDWTAALAAPLYMALTTLPYIALTLVLAVALRSTFLSIIIGLGYTVIFEFILAGILRGTGWTKWLFTNLFQSASYLLNSIGGREVQVPDWMLDPSQVMVLSAVYTVLFLALAAWLYRRQDLGG